MSKILFIGLPYHNYIKALTDEMEFQGHTVTFYPVELRKTKDKILRTLSPSSYIDKLDRYHSLMIRQEKKEKYDYIIFLQVHTISMSNFLELKDDHPESKFILYTWDALSPLLNYVPYIPYFDKVYTFDPTDAKNYGLNYLPLFCVRDFQNLPIVEPDTDVYMVGNLVKPDRYRAIQAFERYCKENDIRFKKYIKCTPVVIIQLLIKGFLPRGLKLRSISRSHFIHLLQYSIATFDFANHKQSGYTMRFIENMCAGKKIITNNKRAIGESFYSSNRFFVFDELNFDGIKEFIQEPIKDSDVRFDEFSIQSFISTLLTI